MSDYDVVWPRDKHHYLLPARAERNALADPMPYMGGEIVNPKSIRTPKREKGVNANGLYVSKPRARKPIPDWIVCKVCSLRRERFSHSQIARTLNISVSEVRRVLDQREAA